MANYYKSRGRGRGHQELPQTFCKKHPNIPAAQGRDLCVNCASYEDLAKQNAKKR